MVTFLFGISMGEILVVFLVVLLLFGADKIPEFARMLGKGINEFRKAADDIKREFDESSSDLKEDLNEAKHYISEQGREMKEDLKRAGKDVKETFDGSKEDIKNEVRKKTESSKEVLDETARQINGIDDVCKRDEPGKQPDNSGAGK
jgi:TatA/E family protein of Tat protein translocase